MTTSDPRGLSRRTFLCGVGGGAACVSIAWGVSEWGFPFLEPGGESRIATAVDAYAEYDGWLVTTEDKARMVLVDFVDGWYDRETDNGSAWRWSGPTAMLSFQNPRTPAVLHLDYDARADLFPDAPRTVTITVGDQVAQSFVPDAAGQQQTNVLLPVGMLGERSRVDVQIAVDRPFVPASMSIGSQDTRELGIQVYRATVERSPEPVR
ncbi:MAG: hypothetical protein F4Y45_04505 [Acidobacteria bacterium]|nr:hypothetical protein [Acidobacteriota bacterium]MYJ06029.1 hypothetical protein [Acidobacteriota bacterium]